MSLKLKLALYDRTQLKIKVMEVTVSEVWHVNCFYVIVKKNLERTKIYKSAPELEFLMSFCIAINPVDLDLGSISFGTPK